MGVPGPWEMVIIFLIILVIFGAGKLPQVFESFGKGMKSFRDAQKEGDDTLDMQEANKVEAVNARPSISQQVVDEVEELVDPATVKTEVS